MQKLKQHIAFKILSCVLVLALATPGIIKFAHTFSHHEHKLCLGDSSTHIHQIDLDCDFHKFNSQQSLFKLIDYEIKFWSISNFKFQILTYNFFYKHRTLSFSLRGPPVFSLG